MCQSNDSVLILLSTCTRVTSLLSLSIARFLFLFVALIWIRAVFVNLKWKIILLTYLNVGYAN